MCAAEYTTLAYRHCCQGTGAFELCFLIPREGRFIGRFRGLSVYFYHFVYIHGFLLSRLDIPFCMFCLFSNNLPMCIQNCINITDIIKRGILAEYLDILGLF